MLMTTHAGVGMSRHHNPNVAGREAAEQALKKAGVDEPDFVLMFASIGYDQHTLLRTVRETIGGAPLSGCSVEGTIAAEDADETNYCVVVTANFDNFLAGLEGSLPSDRFLPLWGGGAGNNFDAGAPTYQYCDDKVVSDAVAYALLSGRAQVGWAMSHSLIPIGGARIVTRCKGNVIYEIDGKPAAEVLKEYLPEQALAKDEDWLPYSISLALCFRAPNYMKDEEHVVRGIPAVKMADESITVQTEVSEGTSIWFSSRDKEKVATGLDRMAAQIKEQIGGEKPKLVFQFDCATRGKMMFREQEKLKLLRQFRQSVGPDVTWAGIYAFGEIGPVEEHNNRNLYTAVALALS